MKTYLRANWDRVTAWFLIGAGGLALFLGWLGVSRTPLPSEQIPYVVSGGLVGIALIGIGTMLWLSADLRDEWRKLDKLEETVRAAIETAASADAPGRNGSQAARNGTKAPARASRSRSTSDA